MPKKHLERIQDSSVGLDLKLTAKIHREGQWNVAFCPEMPGANGPFKREGGSHSIYWNPATKKRKSVPRHLGLFW
ncbi:MAG TPA: hypothetical protein VMR33_10425 [Candidatus Baltobacteraceae bacterium]|jgi:hypothetical protein|nr:hypothetical protein [Candidatus Baltobacteraceae bacterium]